MKGHSAAVSRSDKPFVGIGLILLAGVFLSAADAVSKFLTAEIPPLQVTWLRYGTFTILMLAAVFYSGGVDLLRTHRPMQQFLRGVGVTLSSIFFVIGIKYLPIADATATGFVAPLFVTALSIPLLGEVIGWRRWTATIVGLIGVIIVVRPGGAGFGLASMLPVLSALAWAFAMIVTRMMAATERPLTTLAYSAMIGFAMVCVVMPFVWVPLTLWQIGLGVFVGVSSTVGHLFVVMAFRHADASLLAPFSYMQLFWASIFGFLLFAVLPDLWTWIGAVVIAASGLYTAHRERVRARDALKAS
ncbi:MAG: EamA family transporter [Chelatococcus sp.]|nr:MAG: EamA family transporter [Chelatococcus sp.]